jgi:zinc-ribbon family
MIIYGYRSREIVQGTGNFYCPKCETQRPYKHKKIVRYFTLFFLPLFPLGTLSEYVECGVCGRTYKPEILTIPATLGSTSVSGSMSISASPGLVQTSEPAPPSSESKRNSCLPWGLIVAGLISLFAGCLMGIGLIGTQVEGTVPADAASFFLALFLCTGPLALLGATALGGGIFLLRNHQPANIQ